MRRLGTFALGFLVTAATAPAVTADTIPLYAGVGVEVATVWGSTAPAAPPLLSAAVVLGGSTAPNPVVTAGAAAGVTLGLGGSPTGTGVLVDLDALVAVRPLAVGVEIGAAGSILPLNLALGADLGLGISLPNLLGCDPLACPPSACPPPVCPPPVCVPCDPGCPPSAVPAPPGVVLALAALPVFLGRLASRRRRSA
ncbi:MAG TPA: hypothetical protein VD866_18635 [Urbifossiella sp.]|nr:hypothetical protein [Urbifossiella sp.]